MELISFVLPLLYSDCNRCLNILLPSLFHNLNINCLDKFYIYVREKELNKIINIINIFKNKNDNKYNLFIKKIILKSETSIIPNNWGKLGSGWDNSKLNNNEGWWRQQLIKLFAFKHIETDYYIVLDSDVIFLKKINYDNFFKNKKPLLGINYEWLKFHHNWIIYSCDTFFPKKNNLIKNLKDKNIMGVTPQIIIKKEMELLYNYLIDEYKSFDNLLNYMDKKRWINELEHIGWTEFGIYWSFLTINNKCNLYYTDENLLTSLQLFDPNVKNLELNDINKNWCDSIEKLFEKNNKIFGVFQSNIGCSIEKTIKILKHYCNNYNYLNAYNYCK